MRTARLNTLLLLALLAVGGVHLVLRVDPGQRNWELLPGMMTSPASETFAANPVFADGKTLQTVPAGTVVRGIPPLHYAASPEDAARAGRELRSPFSGAAATGPAALARGAKIWAEYCQVCHGPAGKGDGPVAQRGFPAPPSLFTEKAYALPDGQIFHLLTWGQNNMPSYAGQLSREDRWKAVLFVRQLQREAKPRTARAVTSAAAATAPPGATQ
jgi:mono/diheme cytochrome c family protein